jgi:hypothetical protein
MISTVTSLLGAISNRRVRYLTLVAFAALVALAAFLGADQTDWRH